MTFDDPASWRQRWYFEDNPTYHARIMAECGCVPDDIARTLRVCPVAAARLVLALPSPTRWQRKNAKHRLSYRVARAAA